MHSRPRRILMGIAAYLALAFLFGCSVFKPEEPCEKVCDGDMRFSSGDISLGGFSYDMGDNKSLDGHCGFHYVDGRTGGYGNTLEFQSEDCGIHLTWAFYRLLEFSFSKNWRGKVTPSGLRMGDTVAKFMALYPDGGAICDSTIFWKKITTDSYNHMFDDVYIIAYADAAGTIDSLRVTGWYWDPDWESNCR